MTLLWLCLSFVFGVYLGSLFGAPLWTLAISLIPLFIIPFFKRFKTTLLLFSVCIVAVIGGNIYFQSNVPVVDKGYLQFYNDSISSELEGYVISQPESGDRTSTFQFSVNKINLSTQTIEIRGKALVRVPRYTEYHYGDALKIVGRLETPPIFNDFDYKGYLAHQGICSIINYPSIKVIKRDAGSPIFSFIYSIRNTLSQSLSFNLPEPHCSLAQGMLLGLRGNIPDVFMESLTNTGTAHIIAISGLNLSIIIGIL